MYSRVKLILPLLHVVCVSFCFGQSATIVMPELHIPIELKINIENIKTHEGQILVGIYNQEEDFLGENAVAKAIQKVSGTGEMTIVIDNLPKGDYAISVFHDQNSNEKLDTGLFGIPKEPYGFSNNVRPKFSAPKYADALFTFNQDNQHISIRIK